MPRLKAFLHTVVAAALILGPLTWAQEASAALKVVSWNLSRFGQAKVNNEAFAEKYKTSVMKIIVDAVKEYDLIVLQEVVSQDTAMALLKEVSLATGDSYDILVSNPVNPPGLERYAYLYRKRALKVVDSYSYADADNLFSRDPFVVEFSTTQAAVKNFFVIPIHTEPDRAVQEINALAKVYEDAVQRWNLKNGVLIGDMNADCQYVKKSDWEKVSLSKDPRFLWLIKTGLDTASMNSECTFDRIIVAGDKLRANAVNAGLGEDFVVKYNLEVKEARQVSDHFPVEFVIK
jgi:deoxyribonuclease-1-like protein